jgi:hypothetical protein
MTMNTGIVDLEHRAIAETKHVTRARKILSVTVAMGKSSTVSFPSELGQESGPEPCRGGQSETRLHSYHPRDSTSASGIDSKYTMRRSRK